MPKRPTMYTKRDRRELLYIHHKRPPLRSIYTTRDLQLRSDQLHIRKETEETCYGVLRWVGSLKLYVFFAEYRLFYRALLRKRPVILRSLLIVATTYINQKRLPPRSVYTRRNLLCRRDHLCIWKETEETYYIHQRPPLRSVYTTRDLQLRSDQLYIWKETEETCCIHHKRPPLRFFHHTTRDLQLRTDQLYIE